MRFHLPVVRACWLALVAGGLVGLPTFVLAQDQLGTKEGLKKAISENAARRDRLFAGEEQPIKSDVKIAEAAANYYIHRVTHTTEKQEDLYKEFAIRIANTIDKGARTRISSTCSARPRSPA